MSVERVGTDEGPIVTKWLHYTCGLAGLEWHGSTHELTAKNSQKFLDEKCDCDWSNKKQGNIMFACTSAQLQQPNDFQKFLFYHPNTRFIHWYKNNAHGPNVIFIGMYHKFKDDVGHPEWENNAKEMLARLVFTDGEYSMLP